MQSAEFNEIIEAQIIKVQNLLVKKGGEYAPGADTDRLINFRRAAHLQGINMKQALLGMLTKHTVSIADMIGDGKDHDQAVWDEKIGDVLTYMLLLQAVVWEEKNQDVPDVDIDYNKLAFPDARATGRHSTPTPPDDEVEIPTFDTWQEFYHEYGKNTQTRPADLNETPDVIVHTSAIPRLMVMGPRPNPGDGESVKFTSGLPFTPGA